MTKKTLVAYFSASGVTEQAAKALAAAANADLYEIRPAVPYTDADLDWRNKRSRSTVEMNGLSSRPALAGTAPPTSPLTTRCSWGSPSGGDWPPPWSAPS